ncbi:description family protein, partial [Chlamydia psittaci 84-8471/1]
HTSHFMLLYRNLLYTAITRGKQLVVLVGTKKAIAIATRNDKVQHRCTGLLQALEQLTQPQYQKHYH